MPNYPYMMYHTNQKFDITGELKSLPFLIDTTAILSGKYGCFTRDDQPVHAAWKITDNGKYFCIGSGSMEGEPDPDDEDSGWTDFEERYDPEKIAAAIKKWLKEQSYPRSDCDGLVEQGVRCQVFTADLTRMPGQGIESEEDWDDYMSCIACFSPYTCEFAQ